MRKPLMVVVFLLSLSVLLRGQSGLVHVTVRVILLDGDLNQKPVPHLALELSPGPDGSTEAQSAKTEFGGTAEFHVAPGKYRLSTPEGVDFQGRHYSWDVEVEAGGSEARPVSVDLSNDNARIAGVSPIGAAPPPRKPDDLTEMFQKYQKSVVTVWSEIGSGTGFIVDPAGLVMTNQHVIGPSELIGVQFDTKRKVAAKLLAFDAERDVAVLYADLSAFPGAMAAPLASSKGGRELAVEGERVFTIGSPLGLKKIITAGIVSKVEARAILSDVNINHGNSGGPLFNAAGEVIGMTTFLVPGGNGPGVAGIVRIDQTLSVLDRARRKLGEVAMPSARLLPVEPTDPYPLDALRDAARSARFDSKPYTLSFGGFDVALATPVLQYELHGTLERQADTQRRKRVHGRTDSGEPRNSFEPLQDLHGWAEYTGDLKAVLFVQAAPQLRETFGSILGRELVPYAEAMAGGPRYKFKTDFYRMKLLCGETEVEPIQPGKAATVLNEHNGFVNITDATYVGIYAYGPDAISPACGKVTLRIYSEKDPGKSESRELDAKTVERVWRDFRPYFEAHSTQQTKAM